jgi:hypothetical protein
MDLRIAYQHDPKIVTRLIAGEMILVPIRKHISEPEAQVPFLCQITHLRWNSFHHQLENNGQHIIKA